MLLRDLRAAQSGLTSRAVEALAKYLPEQAEVLRDGREEVIDAAGLVPGDVLLVDEGDRIIRKFLLRTSGRRQCRRLLLVVSPRSRAW